MTAAAIRWLTVALSPFAGAFTTGCVQTWWEAAHGRYVNVDAAEGYIQGPQWSEAFVATWPVLAALTLWASAAGVLVFTRRTARAALVAALLFCLGAFAGWLAAPLVD